MTRLKFSLILVGLVLVVTAIVMDVSLGREAWSRIVGWVAIAVLAGAVAVRAYERRVADRKERNQQTEDHTW